MICVPSNLGKHGFDTILESEKLGSNPALLTVSNYMTWASNFLSNSLLICKTVIKKKKSTCPPNVIVNILQVNEQIVFLQIAWLIVNVQQVCATIIIVKNNHLPD